VARRKQWVVVAMAGLLLLSAAGLGVLRRLRGGAGFDGAINARGVACTSRRGKGVEQGGRCARMEVR
jgi:hypothetical protein